MRSLVRKTAWAGALALLLGLPAMSLGTAWAQDQPQQGDPADDQGDSGAMTVRIGRLEGQLRTLTGQIEQLQYQNKKLEDDLRKMQGDVDFRFQDLQRQGGAGTPRPAAPARRSDAEAPPAADQTAGGTMAPMPIVPTDQPRVKTARGDAFDPSSDPNAPGAPRPLGTTTPSQPLAARTATTGGDQHFPLDLMSKPGAAAAAAGIATDPDVIPAPVGATRDTNSVASLTPGGTREEYDTDLGLYKQGQFDGAANGFQAFVSKYPRDRLVPDAVYLAGESFARLGRHREAAEQFLKVSTDYGRSPRAPDALLRLGMSLNALGAKEQACATFLEVTRRYPVASADVRAGVDRELKRARCPENG